YASRGWAGYCLDWSGHGSAARPGPEGQVLPARTHSRPGGTMTALAAVRIATDFSEHAERATLRGARLARLLGVPRAELLHVRERSRLLAVQSLLDEQTGLAIEQALASAVESVEQATGVHLKAEVREGRKINEAVLEGA